MYLFIAIKPDSEDYCRGCLMARYSSDLRIENHLDRQKLINIWTSFLLRNKELDCGETGYSFYIFKNGIQVWGENDSQWDGRNRHQTEEDVDLNYDEDEASEKNDLSEIYEIHKQSSEDAEEIRQQVLARQKAEAEIKTDREAQEARQRRLAEYEKLKKEFS